MLLVELYEANCDSDFAKFSSCLNGKKHNVR